MDIQKLRYKITGKKEVISMFREYENFKLFISDNIDRDDIDELLARIEDDVELKLEIPETADGVIPRVLQYDYTPDLFDKSEILAFLYAGINPDWDIIKGFHKINGKTHFYLKTGKYIYDPSLAVICLEEEYSKEFKEQERIENNDIEEFLREYDNLQKYYKPKFRLPFLKNKPTSFSKKLLADLKKQQAEKIEEQFEIPEDLKEVKQYYGFENFRKIRQMMTRKRKWELETGRILAHPDISPEIVEQIERDTDIITERMKGKIKGRTSYHYGTIGNCYALSIMYNIYNKNFNLVQGGITYEDPNYPVLRAFARPEDQYKFFQHSWCENDEVVYDPSLRMVVPKELYYKIFEKEDVYTKEDTKEILKRIGFNLTYFSHFLKGRRIGNDESIMYRTRSINTPERKQEGEEFIKSIED